MAEQPRTRHSLCSFHVGLHPKYFLLHVITDSGGYHLRTDYLLSATITRSGKFAGQILYIRGKKKMQPERKELGKKTYESNYSPTLTGLVP